MKGEPFEMSGAAVMLFEVLTAIAKRDFDGHMSILRFTGGWRVELNYQAFHGRDIDSGSDAGIQQMPKGGTFEEAALAAIKQWAATAEKRMEYQIALEREVHRLGGTARSVFDPVFERTENAPPGGKPSGPMSLAEINRIIEAVRRAPEAKQ